MRIYFKNVTYQAKPLIWTFDESTNSAKCNYKIAGSKDSINPELVNNELKDIIGVQIVDGIACIDNIQEFRKRYPFTLVSLFETNQTEPGGVRTSFFSKSFASLPATSDPTHSTESGIRSARTRTELVRSSLDLETLLADYRGETLVYEKDLKDNNEINLKRLAALKVHSSTSINLSIQVIKNIDYYYIRQLQMQLIRSLFEEIFISSLRTFREGQSVPKSVMNYFTNAIRSIMINSKYNTHDTAFEISYYQEGEPIPCEENYRVREIYARTMLKDLQYFASDLPLSSTINDLELRSWLEDFKKHIQLHQQKLDLILRKLTLLTICVGLIEHDNKKLTLDACVEEGHIDFSLLLKHIKASQMGNMTLGFALNQLNMYYEIPETSLDELPPKIHPIRSIVQSSFKIFIANHLKKGSLPESEINHHMDAIINALLPEFMSCTQGNSRATPAKWISHTLKSSDQDLYMSDEWGALLMSKIKASTKDLAFNKKDSKNIELWKKQVIIAIKDFLVMQLNQLNSESQLDTQLSEEIKANLM